MSPFPLVPLCVVLLTFPATAPSARDNRSISTTPCGRGDPKLVYDSFRKRIVMFGGQDGTKTFGDTWEWDGLEWTDASPRSQLFSPPPRTGAGMAYDPIRKVTVLFGGIRHASCRSALLADTWEWDGTRWTQVEPRVSPSPRHNPAMCFYPGTNQIVLFGGGDSRKNPGCHQMAIRDMWAFDGSNWTEIEAPSSSAFPTKRFGAGLVYDQRREQCVLFGGWSNPNGGQLDDTWTYTAAEGWREKATRIAPSKRGGFGFAYDPVRQRVLLVGGFSVSVESDETWEWDGTRWTRLDSFSIPTQGTWRGMALDEARGELIAFGGRPDSDETWVRTGLPLYGVTTSIVLTPLEKQRPYLHGSEELHESEQFASDLYWFDGSASGTRPGFGGGSAGIPLNLDPQFDLTVANRNSAIWARASGDRDASRRSHPELRFPTTSDTLGLTLRHVRVVFDHGGHPVRATNPVSKRLK